MGNVFRSRGGDGSTATDNEEQKIRRFWNTLSVTHNTHIHSGTFYLAHIHTPHNPNQPNSQVKIPHTKQVNVCMTKQNHIYPKSTKAFYFFWFSWFFLLLLLFEKAQLEWDSPGIWYSDKNVSTKRRKKSQNINNEAKAKQSKAKCDDKKTDEIETMATEQEKSLFNNQCF